VVFAHRWLHARGHMHQVSSYQSSRPWHPYYAASAAPLMPSTGEWQGAAMLSHDEQVEI